MTTRWSCSTTSPRASARTSPRRCGPARTLIEGSITETDTVAEAFERAQPDRVFHLAAQIDVRRSVTDPVYDLGVNVGGTLNLLEASRQREVGRFVFASTGGAIYGEGDGRELPFPETAECRPDAPYGQSKLAAEGYLGLYRRLYGLETIVVRLGNVYGPRQDPRLEAGVVAIFCGALTGGEQPIVFGDGDQTRDYVYVGDVADAFAAAADGAGAGTLQHRHRGRDERARARPRDRRRLRHDVRARVRAAAARRGQANRGRPLPGGGGARLERRDLASRGDRPDARGGPGARLTRLAGL